MKDAIKIDTKIKQHQKEIDYGQNWLHLKQNELKYERKV